MRDIQRFREFQHYPENIFNAESPINLVDLLLQVCLERF